ncbi:enoyl-CoA hydratase/isomerase family protein [bacterium]|nr:enoyl-CoA hydratase/isomerase family protein [bacterium]
MIDGSTVIESNVQDGVATLWLNRPERLNALNIALIGQACEQLKAWEEDDAVRCVVLRGRGRAFCAGDDIKGMAADREAWEKKEFTLRREAGYERLFKTLYDLRKPTIASLHGFAVGAGLLIALACDIRIAADDSKLGFVFVKRGITGGTTIAARYIGLGKATEMLLTGDTVDGAEAERIGLVNVCVPHDELDAETERWARKLAAGPTRVLGFAKYALHHGLYEDLETAFALNSAVARYTQDTDDAAEGRSAFAEHRTPQFKGT